MMLVSLLRDVVGCFEMLREGLSGRAIQESGGLVFLFFFLSVLVSFIRGFGFGSVDVGYEEFFWKEVVVLEGVKFFSIWCRCPCWSSADFCLCFSGAGCALFELGKGFEGVSCGRKFFIIITDCGCV